MFLALGRKELAPFAAAPQHVYLVRSVDPVDPPLDVPHAIYIVARGPFSEADERALLKQHRHRVRRCQEQRRQATYGKIAAARALGIDVIMLRRPALPGAGGRAVEDAGRLARSCPRASAARGV